MPAKAAHALRQLLKPSDGVALVLTVPSLACAFPVWRGVVVAEWGTGFGVRGPSPRKFYSCSKGNMAL